MTIKQKLRLTTLFISLFLSCLVEKFIYPNDTFVFLRGIICIISSFLVLNLIYDLLDEKKKTKLSSLNDKFYDWFVIAVRYIYKHYYYFKVLFSIIITFYATIFYKDIYYFIFGLCEISIIYFISNLISNKYKKTGMIVNIILTLLYNINVMFLIYGGSFISLIMLTNLNSINDLKGKMFIYIIAAIFTIVFSIIPYKKREIVKKSNILIIIIFLIYEIILFLLIGNTYSPIYNYGILIYDDVKYINLQNYIKNTTYTKEFFYKEEISDYVKFDNSITNNPNIILIFTEGLSKNIILDNRNIMPNVKKYMNESLNFEGYYNHTAATYRGLIGQLYSGYQLVNSDENHLISIESILKKKGYNTEFINTEPNNGDFTIYLNSMNFDLISTNDTKDGVDESMSDKSAYEFLFERAIELQKSDKPFFLGIYTLGTHVSLDSYGVKYRDGSSNILNRFYDADYQFGQFMTKFNESDLYNNTIVIYTTDHATYSDYDYLKAFSGVYQREFVFLDEIPLFIYHKNVKKENIEVNGRNSIDLAPTILDYLDISEPNYFLGDSLFSGKKNKIGFDTVFTEGVRFISSKDKSLELITDYDKTIYDINGYLSISSK